MDNILMDIQLEEPTIEYNVPKQVETQESVSPVEEKQVSNEPYMFYEVPEPTIEMPKLKGPTDEELYELYLNYQDYLLAKYGDSWSNELDETEKQQYMEYYNDSHDMEQEEKYNRIMAA